MPVRIPTIVIAALLISSGCASTSDRPIQEMTEARSSITLAEQVGAQQHAVTELTMARQKMDRATTLVDHGKYDAAARLANEATVDARLAAARASLFKSEQAADELNATLTTLETELNRDQ